MPGSRRLNPQTLPLIDSVINGPTAYYRELRDSLRLTAPSKRVSPGLVTQAANCARAAQLLDSLAQTGASGRRVYVYKLGSFFAAEDTALKVGGGWRQLEFFTSNWAHLKGLTH